MFERYTEKARRVIFFARYEASQFGQPYIETEHLLMGLLREDKALTNRFLRSHASVESIRKQVEAHTTIREKTSTSVDLPLSDECKRVLAYAAEEAERLGHKHIGTEHLLLGLMREENSFAANILKERGLELAKVREELASVTYKPAGEGSAQTQLPKALTRDLTQAALDGELDPLVGREQEFEGVIEILGRRNKKNLVLVGERGVGKTAIVEGLAKRIADGNVPSFLAEARIVSFEIRQIPGAATDSLKLGVQLIQIVQMLADASNAILFIESLKTLLLPVFGAGPQKGVDIFMPAMLEGERQFIGTATPGEYQELIQAAPWVGDCFRAVHVGPLDEETTLQVLKVRKHQYEKFHGVTYSEEALDCAAHCAGRFLPDSPLPGKALELLDAAGARVRLREVPLPEEIIEVQKRIKFIVHRMDSAIANHEFVKARFYEDEERKETENLAALREKYKISDSPACNVTREDVEEVIARSSEYPFQP
ncbi:MAG: Clp protease N-terminal domain-containing protein [Terracidiphilus sp.]|jgi:ATP-dependent Clp protease ATP-binding subunit ClpC